MQKQEIPHEEGFKNRQDDADELDGIVRRISEAFTGELAGGIDDDLEIDGVVEGEEDRRVEIEARRRTERLGVVREGLEKLWEFESQSNPQSRVEATQKIADGCRDVKWRKPVGDAGILDFHLEIFSRKTNPAAVTIQILRLIGNGCADTNENRARVLGAESLKEIIKLLEVEEYRAFALTVLFNICVDYEPAQKQAIANGIILILLELLSDSRDNEVLITYAPKLLGLMVNHELPEDQAPSSTPLQLLEFALSDNITEAEDFLHFTTIATQYLTKERFQKFSVSEQGLTTVLRVFSESYTRFEDLDEEDTQAMVALRKALVEILADISDLPSFTPLILQANSNTADILRSWLDSTHLQLQVCACLMLGNVARSDATCILFVQEWKLHKQLIQILTTASDTQILHAAVGFLKNLALPLPNKPILGEAGVLDSLPRLWKLEVLQQVQFSSISLARQLIVNTPTNVLRLLGSQFTSSNAESTAATEDTISILSAIFTKTDIEPTKMEISRLFTTICRVLSKPSQTPSAQPPATTDSLSIIPEDQPDQLPSARQEFFSRSEHLQKPLSFMITQSKWPALRSEAFFVFALTARSTQGAAFISHMSLSSEVFPILQETLIGPQSNDLTTTRSQKGTDEDKDKKESSNNSEDLLAELTGENLQAEEGKGKRGEQMKGVDRMNVLVLLTEVLKNCGSHDVENSVLSGDDRLKLEGLVREGSSALGKDS